MVHTDMSLNIKGFQYVRIMLCVVTELLIFYFCVCVRVYVCVVGMCLWHVYVCVCGMCVCVWLACVCGMCMCVSVVCVCVW